MPYIYYSMWDSGDTICMFLQYTNRWKYNILLVIGKMHFMILLLSCWARLLVVIFSMHRCQIGKFSFSGVFSTNPKFDTRAASVCSKSHAWRHLACLWENKDLTNTQALSYTWDIAHTYAARESNFSCVSVQPQRCSDSPRRQTVFDWHFFRWQFFAGHLIENTYFEYLSRISWGIHSQKLTSDYFCKSQTQRTLKVVFENVELIMC